MSGPTDSAAITVQQQDDDEKGAFFVALGGKRAAEMAYSHAGPSTIIISHTQVSDALRGQGVGRRLLDALVAWARTEERKVIALCPYARSEFEKDPSLRDVLHA
jgi:predicted GNAT family acetyltransferase